MFFNGPACFRLNHIPIRPLYWLRRPYLACGNPLFDVVARRVRKDG